MKQIYYTQCPIGYGLGATSGFQIKRLDPEYPTSGDFRHLALRAFLPGTRDLAPPALRYRRDGEVPEVAWLTPRTHEYETEGGRLWGRPGGQFAHGVRLEVDELAALRHWPAGLYDRPCWVRSDPERTLGRPPEEREIGPRDLLVPPEFERVAPLARQFDRSRLAGLLSALARVVRDSRTLVVLGVPESLWRVVAVLTFAFPEPLRAELTFSTYHDRPEELSGFRIQGTTPMPRANRSILASLGILADLVAGGFEPEVAPCPWAWALAGWLIDEGGAGRAAWERTARRLNRLKLPEDTVERWSDDWLEHLIGFDAHTRPVAIRPTDRDGWIELLGRTRWSARHGLESEWAEAHGPLWWGEGFEGANPPVEARVALVAQGRLPGTWRPIAAEASSRGTAWGDVAARWFARSDTAEQAEAASRLLRSAPGELRGAFLAAFVRGLGEPAGGELIDRLASDRTFDRGLLLPVEAARHASTLDRGRGEAALGRTLDEALTQPDTTTSTLSAIADALGDSGGIVEQVASLFADRLERYDLEGWEAAWCWALDRGDGECWLRPYLRRLFAHPDRSDAWEGLAERTPQRLRPALARTALNVARDPNVSPSAFLWALNRLLLPLEPASRPIDARWPDDTLARLSGLDLTRQLYLKTTRARPLTGWLAEAGRGGVIGAAQASRLRVAREFASALEAGDATFLVSTRLPDVPPDDRGGLLGLMIGHVSGTTFDGVLRCLDAATREWTTSAFLPGSAGLDGIAEALARAMARFVDHPPAWCDALAAILVRAGAGSGPPPGYEPDGLAASVVAAATGPVGAGDDVWPLRNELFGRDDAWPCLALGVQRDLPDRDPQALALGLSRWNDGLHRGSAPRESRFHELVLNASARSGPWALRKLVHDRVRELITLDRHLPWWDHAAHPGARDDIRDAFARLVPLVPLPSGIFHEVRRWLRTSDVLSELDLDLAPEDILHGVERPRPAPGAMPHLSELGWARWSCIEALTVVSRPGLAPLARWQSVESWTTTDLPLGHVDEEDRHRFVSELIRILDGYDPEELTYERQISRLAVWLVKAKVRNVARVQDWVRDLATLGSDDLSRSRRRMVGTLVTSMREELESLSRRGI